MEEVDGVNDSLFLFGLLYLIIASTLIGFMPDSFFTGDRGNVADQDDLRQELDGSEELSFFNKLSSFMFVPIVINGLPTLIAVFLQLLHLLIMIFNVIYGIKLFWSGV